MKFYIPPTLEQDFVDWLNTDVSNINYDFELVRDWYARSQEGYRPVKLPRHAVLHRMEIQGRQQRRQQQLQDQLCCAHPQGRHRDP